MLDAGNTARWAFDGLLSTVAKDLFDGPSTTRFDSTAPIVAIDLSDLYNDNANLSIAFTCASAWMEAALATPGNGQRFAVYDEAWRVLAHAHGAIDRLQQQFRLARSWGLSNVLVLHNLRDTLNVGAAGCAERNKAESLLALAGTKIIGYQPAKEIPLTTAALDLTVAESTDHRQRVPRGVPRQAADHRRDALLPGADRPAPLRALLVGHHRRHVR